MLTYCDITDLVHSAKQLNQFATLDAMTGLFNRRHFLNLADAEWSRFQRYHRPLSMLMIDADHFKSINDRFGHAVGDAALVAIANACTTDQRSSDIVGRIGGEEFALLLPETDLAQAGCVAERICSKVASHLQSSESGTFNLTVSIGLATATQGMSGVSALMKAADHALYQAKYGGRNRIAIFKPETPEQPRVAAE